MFLVRTYLVDVIFDQACLSFRIKICLNDSFRCADNYFGHFTLQISHSSLSC